jgi:hypothetical protein
MSRITTCPHCSTRIRVSEQITDRILICPHCLAEVDNAHPGFQIRAADLNTDVKRDTKVGSIVLAVLIGLCVCGIVLAFWSSRILKGETSIAALFYMVMLFAGLDVLVSVAIIRGLVRRRVSGIRAPSARKVLGIVFLSFGTVVAVVIFFFFTCLGLAIIG